MRFSMLRQILLVLLNQKWLFRLSNKKLIEKQNSNFLPPRNFKKILKNLEEQTKKISTKLNHLQIQLTDIHHLGCPKIRFFVEITKSYRFSMNDLSPINLIPSPTCHQINLIYQSTRIQRENCWNKISSRKLIFGH